MLSIRIKTTLLIVFILCMFTSCKTVQQPISSGVSTPVQTSLPVIPVPMPSSVDPTIMKHSQPHIDMNRHDIYHVVSPGETLWRISKMYDVPINELMKINKIPSPQELKKGQKLFIPNAAKIKFVIPLYPTKKWTYIILHHSATDVGDALSFDKVHKNKGWWGGLGYHFVIDNGTKTKAEGHIEISPRWIKQQNGAHCKANSMNKRGIGVCLVGNFSTSHVSEKQMDALVYLVNLLRNYYKIPKKNIIGHGQVKGAATECPGKKFPWKRFYARL